MSRHSLLDPKLHHDIKVINKRGSQFGENTHIIPVIADEVRALVTEYPIYFLKDNQTGQFGINVMTGFEAGENLFLKNDKWTTHYLPLHVLRQPFMVGVRGKKEEQPTPQNTVVTIDLESKRVSKTEGESLFDKNGTATTYLNSISKLLTKLVEGIPRTEQFVQALLKHELIMPMKLDFALHNVEKKSLDGLYGIDEQKLNELSGDDLQEFHSKGYLQACYMIIASLGRIQSLIDIKNNL